VHFAEHRELRQAPGPACAISLPCIVSCNGVTLVGKADDEPLSVWTSPVWRNNRQYLCGACTGKSRCRGGIG